ncbi:MAG: aminoacyl-tRNA hydrolase [Patescibacteria group bacterium]
MKLIVGLGNPGKEYEGSRHNVGFLVVNAIAEANGSKWKADVKHHADITKITADDGQMMLAKPTTFMNLSGQAVSALAKYYKIKPADILIVQDELDLLPGTFRFSEGGRSGGHHGLESIQEFLPDYELARLRVGIGKPKFSHKSSVISRQLTDDLRQTTDDVKGRGTKDWVLTKPKGKEAELINQAAEDAAQAVIDWASHGLKTAMNRWNSRNHPDL